MPAQFTVNPRPIGYDQTQKRFRLYGTLAITGNYTNGTALAILFTNALTSTGQPYILPPTYNGLNGQYLNVALFGMVSSSGGYTINYDPAAKGFRIFNGTTELASGTVPAAISGAGIPAWFEFLRG